LLRRRASRNDSLAEQIFDNRYNWVNNLCFYQVTDMNGISQVFQGFKSTDLLVSKVLELQKMKLEMLIATSSYYSKRLSII
jgi:hypothetical protein